VLKPHAFVVMPFGTKPLQEIFAPDGQSRSRLVTVEIDFDAVYNGLLEPALRQAGCEPRRADSDTSAGDIRTDMFFELVTADLVVADTSIPNPNVYYELGVRHGVRPHGILPIQSDLVGSRPFDIAQDRTFRYKGSLFASSKAGNAPPPAQDLKREIDRLSQTFVRALARERESIGSPVYESLPGLIPVNWDNIQNEKAKRMAELRDAWLERVQTAKSKGYPGDIKTLADEAPTRVHRTDVLYHGACALLDLCRYAAAERELKNIIYDDPDHLQAQLQLGRVLTYQDKTSEAEDHLRSILRRRPDQPEAAESLGHFYRRLWYLSWRRHPDQQSRKIQALADSHMAAQAVRSFLRAQRSDPGAAYFAGFNALILFHLVNDLHAQIGGDLAESWPADLDEQELLAVVKFCAKNLNTRAQLDNDSETQFWTTTTLSGIALIQKHSSEALQHIRDACVVPGVTLFQLQTLEERLALLGALDFEPDFIKQALALVDEARIKKERPTYQRVFVWAGYALDTAGQTPARFPASQVEPVQAKIEKALEDWNVGPNDLAICEGVREGDILFAEACRKYGAHLRLMLLEPNQTQSRSWPFVPGKWADRFHRLLQSKPDVEVWRHAECLGPAFDEGNPQDQESLLRRHKNWMINTASMEAEPLGDRLYGLILCNENDDDCENPAHPSYFIQRIGAFNDYQGQVETVSAAAAAQDSAQAAQGAS
jgi:tetratricopeptide (TPR) repeat protein